MGWSSRVTTISLEMSLPGVLGFWLDGHWGTGVLFTILGVVFGFSLGMLHLVKLAGSAPGEGPPRKDSSRKDSSGREGPNQESG